MVFQRLSAANQAKGERESSICCYADQDKFGVRDPDGYEWELFYLLSDAHVKIQEEASCCVGKSERSACR